MQFGWSNEQNDARPFSSQADRCWPQIVGVCSRPAHILNQKSTDDPKQDVERVNVANEISRTIWEIKRMKRTFSGQIHGQFYNFMANSSWPILQNPRANGLFMMARICEKMKWPKRVPMNVSIVLAGFIFLQHSQSYFNTTVDASQREDATYIYVLHK